MSSVSFVVTVPWTGTRHVFLPRSSSHAYRAPLVDVRMQMQSCWRRSCGFSGVPRRARYEGAAATTKRPGSVSRTWTMSRSMASLTGGSPRRGPRR